MHKRNVKFLVVFLALFLCLDAHALRERKKDPKRLIQEVSNAVGGLEKMKALGDVQYLYEVIDEKTGKKDISIERYVFDGELSWAKYLELGKSGTPDQNRRQIQSYDGQETWVTVDQKLIESDELLRKADFLRKTNYYWFAMMHKLQDPGVRYSYKGTSKVGDIIYDLVRMDFEEGIGDVNDTYLLYINPSTKLVDQFLFTVMDFGMKDPLLMTVEYEEVAGLLLPATRKYTPASWDGAVKKDANWVVELMKNISFTHGFNKDLFKKPLEYASKQ